VTWARLLRRIELRVLSSLTPKRSFLCDGRPRLCIHCKRVREWFKGHRIPNFIIVFGARGDKWVWTSVKNVRVRWVG